MVDAAYSGKLKGLYVVGSNPFKTFARRQERNRRTSRALDLLIVQDLFVTDTATPIFSCLPHSTYEKGGTLTNTAGEIQMTHRAVDPQGPRSDFDLLRILSHQLSQLGMGPAIRFRTPEAAFDEIRQNISGYDVPISQA